MICVSSSPISAERPNPLALLPTALYAGAVAAVTTTLELYVTTILPAHGSLATMFASIAAIVCGPVAPPFDPVLFGVLAHLFISIGWAYGYTDLASRTAALSRAPWISGPVFGLLVFLAMQLILLSVHQFHTFTPLAFLNNMILHTLFFGTPIALVVARGRYTNT